MYDGVYSGSTFACCHVFFRLPYPTSPCITPYLTFPLTCTFVFIDLPFVSCFTYPLSILPFTAYLTYCPLFFLYFYFTCFDPCVLPLLLSFPLITFLSHFLVFIFQQFLLRLTFSCLSFVLILSLYLVSLLP